MEQRYKYFPLFVKMEGVRVLVFGAGDVATRRVRELAKTTCELTVVAPDCSKEMEELIQQWEGRIQYVNDVYRPGCLMEEDMDLVLALTDDEKVNETIYRECRHRDIKVNVASNHELCSFYFPAIVDVAESELLVAIASADATKETHAKVRALRERLEAELGERGNE